MTNDSSATLSPNAADQAHRTGTWLRLPCCENDFHVVKILGTHDGVMTISAPREPHQPWTPGALETTQVTLGWSDAGGTLALSCQIVSHDPARWDLRVVSTGDFVQRRKHLRVPTNGTANLMDGTLDKIVAARITDLSEAGMRCVFSDYIPNPAQPLTRWAVRLDGAVLVIVANLVWAARSGPIDYVAGYEFLEVHDALLSRLRAHIMAQLVKHGPMPDTRDHPSGF